MRKTGLLLLLISLVFLVNSCEDKREVVAEAGNLQISKIEFKEHLKRFKVSNGFAKPFSFDEKMNQLNSLLDQKIEFLIARDMGLTESPLVKLKAEVVKEFSMIQKWQREILKSELINENILRDYYRKKHQFAEYKHILISHHVAFPVKNQRSQNTAMELADSLKKVIESGVPFDSLVQKYSDDEKSRDRYGYFGWQVRSEMTEPLEKAIFSAPLNEVIGPIQDRNGFHIVIVLNRKEEKPQKPFLMIRNQLKKEYERKINQEYFRYLRKFEQKFINEYNVQINEKDAKVFYEIAKNWVGDPRRDKEELIRKTQNLILLSGDGYDYHATKLPFQLRDFVTFMQKNALSYGQFRQFLTKGIPYVAKLIHAYKIHLDEDPDVRFKYKKTFQDAAISELHRKWRLSIKNTQEEMREYYETHKTEFKQPAKIEVWGIAIKNRDKAKEIYLKLKGNPSQERFEAFAEKYSENKLEAKKKGYLGWLTPIDRKSISKVAFSYGENRLIPPVKTEYYYYILKTGKMTAERIASFDEVKLEIDKKLFTRKFNDIRLTKIAEFKKEINPYSINLSVLREINI